jgi:hypothetical protein
MRILSPRRRALAIGWLTLATLVGCSSSTFTQTGFDDSSCPVGRRGSLTINGAPGALAASGTCGSVTNVQGDLAAVGFINPTTSSPVANFTMGRAARSYSFGADNKTTVNFYYGLDNQSSFCKTPSGTVVAISLSPSDDPAKGAAEGSYNNITLCNAAGDLVYTVSGLFRIE